MIPHSEFHIIMKGVCMNEETNRENARASPGAAAREMAMTALAKVGALIESPETDPRVLLQAAKLVLSVAGQEDAEAPDDGGLELRFTGGSDGDL